MIKYYDTEAAYAAAAKSEFESQVSLVGESNAVHFDGRNVIVGAKHARTGAIAVLDGSSALHFVAVDTYSSASFMSNYTVVGVVAIGVDHPDYRGKIAIVHKANDSKQWSAIYSFRLTGYTLDGAEHTGKLSVREASDSWAANHEYTVTYTASTVEEMAAALNTYFRANAPFTTQNWRAEVNNGAIDLKFLFTDWRQVYNSANTGFSASENLLPDIPSSSAMLRYNGVRSGEGAISNWDRALAFYRNDNGSSSYLGGRTSEQTSVKQAYPINLPTWLGTSTQNPGDFCAALRAVYGQGEAGWLKFMKTCLPVRPTAYGPMGDKDTYGDGLKNTGIMAGKTFTMQNDTVVPAYPAADYCGSVVYNHELLKKGCWQLPDVDTLAGILSTIKYGTNSNRNADPVNKALYAIGGTAINNGSGWWSASRYYAASAWYAHGGFGFFYYGYMYLTVQALPVVLLDVSDSEL